MRDNIYNNMHDSYTDTIIISRADVTQLPQVKRFFKDNGFRAQAARSDVVYIARFMQPSNNQPILGALRLCSHDDSWLLRSMCIKEDCRNQGLGSYILSSIADELKEKKCYCFPYLHLEGFYQQQGFHSISPELAAPPISKLFNNYLSKGKQFLLMQYSCL